MATFIFLLSLVLFTGYLTYITSIYLVLLWFLLGIVVSFIFLLSIYLIQLPIVVSLPINHPYKSYLFRSISYFLNHFILRLVITVEGLENVPETGRLVIIANHKSYTDAFPILEKVKRPMTLTPKKSVMKLPLVNLWLKSYRVFPIDRKNVRATQKDLEDAIQTIEMGMPILIFPEGTIRYREEPKIEHMKSGAFKLPLRTKAAILPIKLIGNERARGRAPFKKTYRHLKILKPIAYEVYKDLNTHQIAELVMNHMNEA